MTIAPPNYTQMPNEILDHMAEMGDAELRVVLAVCRKTFGWHKESDKISISQLAKATGLSRQGVITATKTAIGHGYIKRFKMGNSHAYSLNIKEVVKPVDQQIVKLVDTQKKDKKKRTLAGIKKTIPADPAWKEYEKNLQPITGGSGESYEENLEEALDEKPKRKSYPFETPLANLLKEETRRGPIALNGFASAQQKEEWERMETEMPYPLIVEKIKWAAEVPRMSYRYLIGNIIKAVYKSRRPNQVMDNPANWKVY